MAYQVIKILVHKQFGKCLKKAELVKTLIESTVTVFCLSCSRTLTAGGKELFNLASILH